MVLLARPAASKEAELYCGSRPRRRDCGYRSRIARGQSGGDTYDDLACQLRPTHLWHARDGSHEERAVLRANALWSVGHP
jgi:hypothetical protein